MHHLAVSVYRCTSATAAQVEENWEVTKATGSRKEEPIKFSSAPSDTSARKGERSKTLVIVADAAQESPGSIAQKRAGTQLQGRSSISRTAWSREQEEGEEQNRRAKETKPVTGRNSRIRVTPKV